MKIGKSLSNEQRARWNAIVESEGVALGLSDCRAFLENKLVNDIFYEGSFKGVPCVVKCSSRAPESIANEYAMSRRLAGMAPVCAEALAHWTSKDGRMAFVVTRKLPGPSLTEVIVRGIDDAGAIGILEDMVRIAEALHEAGIVWRDIIPDNFLMDEKGHLRLVDAQFAVDRNNFREAPYMLAHWKYRMLLFAHHPMMSGHGWNDVAMMLAIAPCGMGGDMGAALRERLRDMVPRAAFPMPAGKYDMLRMWCCLVKMCLCRSFTFGNSSRRRALDERIARAWNFISGHVGRHHWANRR